MWRKEKGEKCAILKWLTEKEVYLAICVDLTNHRLVEQKQQFADVLQNRCSKNFYNIHNKITGIGSLFNKAAGLKTCNLIKKRLQHKFFPVNIAKILRTPLL